MKKFSFAAALLVLIALAVPFEHKYDKLFRFFSLTLIPQSLEISKSYDKKIYFYVSDLIALTLLFVGLLWFKIPWKHFFRNPLWIVFICATFSIAVSPFAHYAVAYIRLLQLLTPIILFSFLSTAFTDEERPKIIRLILSTLVAAALFQTSVAIAQYLTQAPLGLRLLGESTTFSFLPSGKRWIFDRIDIPDELMRASATFPHANVFGGFIAFSLLASYGLIMRAKKGKIVLSLTLPFQFFALMVSYSRSALFGWALGSAFWFAVALFKKQRVQFLALTMAFSVATSLFLLYDPLSRRGGVVNYNSVVQISDQIRVEHQNLAWKIIKHNPFFGLGFNQFSERVGPYFLPGTDPDTRGTAPHNIFLFLACETGLISFAAFLFFAVFLLLKALLSPISIESATLTAIFIAFLFIGCCDFYPILFQQGKLMFFSVAGLLAGAVRKKNHSLLLNPQRQDVWKMFDQISTTYDRINRILSLGMDQRWRRQVAKSLPPQKNLKILDLATGTGDQIKALLRAGASIQSITGIDLSHDMLAIAKRKLQGKAELLHANAENLPFPDASFDAATFSFGIRNVEDPLCALKDVYRVLKPSGRCLVLEFSLPPKPIRSFYLFYLRRILPFVGGLLSRRPAAYVYLNQTIEHFPSGKDFSALLEKAGFCSLQRISMALGGVTLYVGEKR